MTEFQPPSPATKPLQSSVAEGKPFRSRRWSKLPWLIGLGVVLLVSGGLGWRWWQSTQTEVASQGQQAPVFPVRLATVETSMVETASEFVGNLESRSSVTLRPAVQGRVTQIYVQSGDRVQAGTTLIQLRAEQRQAELASVLASVNQARAIRSNQRSQLQALQAERISALAEVELQNQQFQRIQQLANNGALPRQQLDQAQRDRQTAIAALRVLDQRIQGGRAALLEAEAGLQQAEAQVAASRAELQDTRIIAPFDGIVDDIPVKVGDYITTNDEATSVTRNQALELRLSIPLEYRAELRVGLPVELRNTQGNSVTRGQISFVSPQVTAEAQSILAKATFPNPNGQLIDQQFVRVRVIWSQRPGVLLPTAAISRQGSETFVFVAESAAPSSAQPTLVARRRSIELGSIQNNRYQVLKGLQPGEQVVVSGVQNLQDGSPISQAPSAPVLPPK